LIKFFLGGEKTYIKNLLLKTNPKIDQIIQQLEKTLNSIPILKILPLKLEICESAGRGDGRCYWRYFIWRIPRIYRHVVEHYPWETILHITFHEIGHALDLFTFSQPKRERNADKFAEKMIGELRKKGLLK
jgi:hypothetical protein